MIEIYFIVFCGTTWMGWNESEKQLSAGTAWMAYSTSCHQIPDLGVPSPPDTARAKALLTSLSLPVKLYRKPAHKEWTLNGIFVALRSGSRFSVTRLTHKNVECCARSSGRKVVYRNQPHFTAYTKYDDIIYFSNPHYWKLKKWLTSYLRILKYRLWYPPIDFGGYKN